MSWRKDHWEGDAEAGRFGLWRDHRERAPDPYGDPYYAHDVQRFQSRSAEPRPEDHAPQGSGYGRPDEGFPDYGGLDFETRWRPADASPLSTPSPTPEPAPHPYFDREPHAGGRYDLSPDAHYARPRPDPSWERPSGAGYGEALGAAPLRAAEAMIRGERRVGDALRTSRRRSGDAAPARPSRWRFSLRMNRKYKLGIFAPLGLAMAFAFHTVPQLYEPLNEALSQLNAAAREQPEFTIQRVEIEGLDRLREEDVVAALDLERRGRFAPAFDLADARAALKQRLPWIDEAALAIEPPHTLKIRLTERRPAALWRFAGELRLLDAEGDAIERTRRNGEWRRLPLLVGEGAPDALPEAVRLLARAQEAGLPIIALTRVGARRWDLELLDAPRVMLPEENATEALETLIALQERSAILTRDLEAVDLRLPGTPTVRLSPEGWAARQNMIHGRSDEARDTPPARAEQGA